MGQNSSADWDNYADIEKDRCASLPRLAWHALRTLEVPASSADAERAFSRPTYNKLIVGSSADSRCLMNPSECCIQPPGMVVDLKAMTIKFYAVGKNESVLATFW